MSVTIGSGGTCNKGESFTITRGAGGLTGALYVSLISPTYGTVACSDVVVDSDTQITCTAPSTGLVHGETLTLVIA